MQSSFVELSHEAFRRGHPVAFLDQLGELLPVEFDVEPGAHPAVMSDVWRDEEDLRAGVDQRALRSWRGFEPDGHPPVLWMAHGEDFAAHLEGWIPNAALLVGLG